MKKTIVALSLGCLVMCVRAETHGGRAELSLLDKSNSGMFWDATEAGDADYSNAPEELYFVAQARGNVERNNYTPLLGAWPHTFTLDDIHSDNGNGFYGIAEKNLSENLAVFMRVGQTGASHLLGYIVRDNSVSNDMIRADLAQDYIVGTGILLNNSWQAGDGLGIAIAHAHNPHALSPANTNWEYAETSWELSYFLPLVKSLNAHTSVFYLIGPGDDLDLNEAIAAELRLNFKF